MTDTEQCSKAHNLGLLISTLFVGLVAGIFIAGSMYTSKLPAEAPGDVDPVFQDTELRVESPYMQAIVSSPVTLSGQVVGAWMFEASLPVRVTDMHGNTLGEGYVTTSDDWMTTEFVSFEGEVSFDTGNHESGFVVFRKDNPSGLPENDEQRMIPVRFVSGADDLVTIDEQIVHYEDEVVPLVFEYQSGNAGFEVSTHDPVESDDLRFVRMIWIMRTMDARTLEELEGTEGPPMITVHVFRSEEDGDLKDWLTQNKMYTNLESEDTLKEVEIAGVSGYEFEWSGLYDGTTSAVKKGAYIYQFTATYHAPGDDRLQEFRTILSTVQFPTPSK